MKSFLRITSIGLCKLMIGLFVGITLFNSCKDEYYFDDKVPSWLGGSIYEYLQGEGKYQYTLKLIDDLNYTEVLKKTGSKTLFVATDSAYEVFFKGNDWGVANYNQLSLSQKKLLLNYTIINNAFLVETLSSYYGNGVLNEGAAMRRATANSPLDSLGFLEGSKLPANSYWNNYRSKGLYLMKDATSSPLVYFFQPFLDKNKITNADVSVLVGVQDRKVDEAHVFNCKITKRDIVCSNGFINVMDRVLVPPTNMADYISTNELTTIFSKQLDRFCAPYFNSTMTSLFHQLHPEFTDSIFEKKYFATKGGRISLPNGLPAKNVLAFDPGWNSYAIGADIQPDMAAMFVPTDDAMNDYFNSGVGRLLKDRFHYWDSIPDAIILPFVKRHMRSSLIESVPSKFSKMVDAENYSMPVERDHIISTYPTVNGEVYITNKVYPPVDYISVYSPVLLSESSKIMDWAIKYNTETARDGTKFAFYKLYLNSLVSTYSLFVPTDACFSKYIDPVAYGQDVQAVLKFYYDEKDAAVYASVFKYNKNSDEVSDSITVIKDADFVINRLHNLLDNHIVVGSVETGNNYYLTKSNDVIKVEGSGSSLIVKGGRDLDLGTKSEAIDGFVFNQANGNTYFLDKTIDPSLRSVYKVMSETPAFSKFFELLEGVPDTCVSQIFGMQGIDNRIKFFNTYRYTIYVPTNEAVQAAIDNGTIKPWSDIYAIVGTADKSKAIDKMIRFLRYHFQDNTVFFGQSINGQYQSATIKKNDLDTYWHTAKNKYYKIGVAGSGSSLTLTTEMNKVAHVVTENGLYNIVVKDFIFNKTPQSFKNADGSGNSNGSLYSTSRITSSAAAVIHQIDNILTFE